jgi:hypothetical protein
MAVLALGLVAGILLVIADLSSVYSIEVNGLPCEPAEPELADLCAPTGGDRHTYALLVLGLFAGLMAWGAGAGRSLPAAAALALCGLVALAIAVVGDLPDVNETGAIGVRFEQAAASPASGFWLSLVGGAMALGAGALGVLHALGERRVAPPPG